MIKRTCKFCGKEYETYPSINLLFCSYKCSSDFKKGKTWEELYKNAEEMFKKARGKRNSQKTEFKKGWQNTEKGKMMIIKRTKKLGAHQSKAEEIAIRLINENNLPFNFVGDGKLIIGSKNPDFIYLRDGRKIIEIFSDYWHRDDIAKYWHQTEEGCKIYYELLGYNVLIIWENELKSPNKVVDKIRDFIDTSLEIEVPQKLKEEIINLSKINFNSDLGQTLKFLLDQTLEYQNMKNTFFENMNYKLDQILELISQKEKPEKSSEGEIKLVSGRRIERREVQNE
jgi:hypothetical protein